MNPSDRHETAANVEETLARIEQRLAKIERVLGMDAVPAEAQAPRVAPPRPDGELEMAVGQNLFAKVGIVVLAIGAALTVSQPWPGLPAMVPSAGGWLLAGGLFVLAWLLNESLPLIARHSRAAAMALLFCATLRLCYFGAPSLLDPASSAAAAVLTLAVAVNLGVGWWRKSVFLSGQALATGYAAALAVGTPWYVFGMVSGLTLVAGWAARKHGWPWLVVFATPCASATYLLWALGNPVVTHRLEVVGGPLAGVGFLLLWAVMSGVFMTARRDRMTEGPVAQVGSVVNCGGYVIFLLHTLARYGGVFAAANISASWVFLGLAVMFWVRERSRFATFLYAMTGYAALSMALLKIFEAPELFVWLSAQSLLVVTTAIWFRSRFIIVANFLIYLGVVACYMALAREASGISLVFGCVALTSARILKWQKDRLELKTELMRNAYLTSAFIVFPYALYHIVPQAWVALSWVGIALFYYGMNLLTQARKYRWMGHHTLLLTVVYILIMGIGRLEGTQRIISFLVLGTVLMVVSLVFTLMRARQHRREPSVREEPPGAPPADP